MNSILNNFFKEERKRVFEPGPYFTQRVMARLSETVPSFWDLIPRATRPVMAISLILLFGILAVQILIPVERSGTAGPIMITVGQDLTQDEFRLFVDPTAPSDAELEDLNLLDLMP
jgi:hypothetical protein